MISQSKFQAFLKLREQKSAEILPLTLEGSIFFKKIYLIFNWSLITIQYCDGFCYTST